MSQQKACKQCLSYFEVTAQEMAFRQKMTPTFAGEKFEIPAPTLCPACRQQRRLAWGNYDYLFQRRCDFTGEQIISPVPPNSLHKVYKNEIWWSDKWDPLSYGRDFDFDRPFFEQLQELHLAVPKVRAYVNFDEGSPYTNCVTRAKDSYLVQSVTDVENCYYGQSMSRSKDCVDSYRVWNSEKCYECVVTEKGYASQYIVDTDTCSESFFLDSCINCKNCFACSNIRQKQYWVYNKQSTKEEYEKARDEFLNLTGEARKNKIAEIRDFLRKTPRRYAHFIGNENSTGDYVYHSKNVKNSFLIGFSENLYNCLNVEYCKDSFDHDWWGMQSERVLECDEVGDNASNIMFTQHCWECTNVMYSIEIFANCHDIFGCVGLTHKQYCILNKQYTKEEYEKLVAKIIKHMQETGEWGEFFPMSMSYFGYNESTANNFYPLEREEAKKLGANWQDEDFGMKFDGPFYEPLPIKEYQSKEKADELLKGVLKCEVSGRPFKIQSKELAFYIENNIQIPSVHPDERQKARFKLTNPIKLHHRRCMCTDFKHGHVGQCSNEFETTYAPDRSEQIYCEDCYQKAMR